MVAEVAEQERDRRVADDEGHDRRDRGRQPPRRRCPRRCGAARTGRRARRPGPRAGTSSAPRPSRLKPRNIAAVSVAPERDTPGTSAHAWAMPTSTPSRRVEVVEPARGVRDLLGQQQQQAERDQRAADQRQVARAGLDLVLEDQPEDPDRDRADDDVEAEPEVERAPHLGSRMPTQRAPRCATARGGSTGATAAIVPSWMTAVKAAPGSSQPAKAGTIRRCAVLEIGRNSVSPWTIPRTIASSALTAPSSPGPSSPARR